jgi:hypothetical protein
VDVLLYEALGVSSSSYHRRIRDDYPNADELHKIATRFHLSFTDLQVRLGFVTREDLVRYVRSRHFAPTASKNVGPDQSTHVAS